jgi:hypothetical protein
MTSDLATILGATASAPSVLGPGEAPVERIAMRFPLWPKAVGDWRMSYGKHASLVQGGDRSLSCAEVEIVRRFRAADYEAVWIDNFGSSPAAWSWASGRDTSLPSVVAARHVALKAEVRTATGKVGGCWDVIAWRGSELIYLESKGPDDFIKPGQRAWRAAAASIDPAIRWVLISWSPG